MLYRFSFVPLYPDLKQVLVKAACDQGHYSLVKTQEHKQYERSYSTSYASSMPQVQMDNREMKFKKGQGGGSSSKNWSFNDPEIQRKKRIASYKLYVVEGKMKGSFRN
ncbi:hypothetical protein IFM89_006687 [Coptis chinensis]|uniref:Uncharacterized protein n=1 Tax=Coptis chinensis TaxID=261450 RepID=A0A835IRV4_9MAGN|nr:hypothetical protein IFM89_006687 [Coptis chinensis]